MIKGTPIRSEEFQLRAPKSSSNIHKRLVCTSVAVLLLLHTALLGWMAWHYSPTVDEPAHLASGLSHWKLGHFHLYRVNPPLVRLLASAPLLLLDPKTEWGDLGDELFTRSEFSAGTRFAKANGAMFFRYLTIARITCIPLSLIGAWCCYLWARDLYGLRAALMALTLWCSCPNILGNGALITADAGGAAMGVASGYAFWRWLRIGDWQHAFCAGLMLGLAELTKSTWIILFALWPVLWFAWVMGAERRKALLVRRRLQERGCELPSDSTELRRPNPMNASKPTVWQLATILLVGLYLLNLGYGFHGCFQQLGRFTFISRSLGGARAPLMPGNRFAETCLGSFPIPIPADYLIGIDMQRYEFERGEWSYLRTEQKMRGWWYYYLYALAVKVPIGTLTLSGLASALIATRLFRGIMFSLGLMQGSASSRARAHWDSLIILSPALVFLVLVSSQTGFSRHLRYALPVLPFIFVWTSQIAEVLPRLKRPRSPPWLTDDEYNPSGALKNRRTVRLCAAGLIMLAVLASVVSSLSVAPHSLSYFNELAGGPKNGIRHLADSNIDWGQDLFELKRWQETNPEFRPLYLAYDGIIDPAMVGIDGTELMGRHRRFALRNLSAGWYGLSLNKLYNYRQHGAAEDEFAEFRRLRPVASAGYSIQIFHVAATDSADTNRESQPTDTPAASMTPSALPGRQKQPSIKD